MIELERHIEILLLDNDCVIVPNLGGFMAHHVEARYDDNDKLFLPPSRTLGFNPKLRLNDSLLAQSYIEAYDISYPEAVNRIEEEVNELQQILYNEGCYELNDIGTLSLNEDGNYEFMPCEAGILTPSLYGLSSIDLEEKKTSAVNEAPALEKNKEEQDAIAAVKQLNTEEEDAGNSSKTISIRVSALRNAVAIAAAIIAFFLITTPLGTGTPSPVNLSNIENSMLYRVMPKEVTSTKTDVKLQAKNAPQIKPAITQQNPNKVSEAGMPVHFWSIVLASKVSMKNAHAYVERLSMEGFSKAEVMTQKSGTRVIYGKYESEQEAYQTLKSLHGHEQFREAWVYEIKK